MLSGKCTAWPDLLQRDGQGVDERLGDARQLMLAALEPVHHHSPYVLDRIRTVDLPVRALFLFELLGRFAAQRLCDVMHQRLGVNLLLDSMGQLPRVRQFPAKNWS